MYIKIVDNLLSCVSAKPWDQQLKTVSVIYEEFYIQGCISRIIIILCQCYCAGRL